MRTLAKLGLLVLLAGLAASACDTGYNFANSPPNPHSPLIDPDTDGSGTTGTTAASDPICRAAELVASGGRRQDPYSGESAIGEVTISNSATFACELRGIPGLRLLKTDGSLIDVQDVQSVAPVEAPVVLGPRGKSTAQLVFTWQNWCGAPPGALVLQMMLSAGGGSLTAPVNGKPGRFVPTCAASGRAVGDASRVRVRIGRSRQLGVRLTETSRVAGGGRHGLRGGGSGIAGSRPDKAIV